MLEFMRIRNRFPWTRAASGGPHAMLSWSGDFVVDIKLTVHKAIHWPLTTRARLDS